MTFPGLQRAWLSSGEHFELHANWLLAQEPAALSGIEPLQQRVVMTALARVTVVEHLGARLLRITFSDGLVRELDFADALPGVLATIDDDEVFAGVAVDSVAGTISWSNGIDLDPDVLHGDDAAASVVQPQVVREYRLQQTS